MMSAAASLGAILLWNVEEGLHQIDKFLHSNEEYIRAGALLAIGIVSSGTRLELDPALALLSEQIQNSSKAVKYAACLGLGLAYAGTAREDLVDELTPIINDDQAGITEVALASLALGMVSHSSVLFEVSYFEWVQGHLTLFNPFSMVRSLWGQITRMWQAQLCRS